MLTLGTVKGFRFSDDLIEKLEKGADNNNTNINNYVKTILENYFKSYIHLEKLHYQHISSDFLKKLLDFFPDEQIPDIAYTLEEDLRKQERYVFSNFDSNNVMDLILINCDLQDIPYRVQKLSGDSIKYNIIHKLGHTYSKIFLESVTNLINKTNVQVETVEYNDQTISFVVHHKDNLQ